MDAVRQNPIGLTCKPLQRMCNNRMQHITTIRSSLLMSPLTPDQHHWLDVATEDEGWCSFRSCTPSRSRARTQAFRQRHVSLTPEKRQCHMLDAPGCHHVETQKNRLWTTLHVWQQEICHYAIFTLTPNVSNVTVINPVSGKTLEHPCSTR